MTCLCVNSFVLSYTGGTFLVRLFPCLSVGGVWWAEHFGLVRQAKQAGLDLDLIGRDINGRNKDEDGDREETELGQGLRDGFPGVITLLH